MRRPHIRRYETRVCLHCASDFMARKDTPKRFCNGTCASRHMVNLRKDPVFTGPRLGSVSSDPADGSLGDRFWSKVNKNGPNGCWVWTSNLNAWGYGTYTKQHKGRAAHRLAFTELRGEIPPGLFVCHHCDNPACVNPDHLFLGTPKENSADRDRKGRRIAPRGEACGASKLTADDVLAIRASVDSHSVVARRYGVDKTNISAIRRRLTWKHVATIALIVSMVPGCSLKTAQIAHPILQGADLLSTHYAEARGAYEVNPLLKDAGWPARIALKSAATVGILYLTNKIGREHKTLATTVLTVINVVYAGVITNNLFAAQASRRP